MRFLLTVVIVILLDFLVVGIGFNVPLTTAKGIYIYFLFGIDMALLWEGLRLYLPMKTETAKEQLRMVSCLVSGVILAIILVDCYWWVPWSTKHSLCRPIQLTAIARDIAPVTPSGYYYWVVIDGDPGLIIVPAKMNPEVASTKPGQRISIQYAKVNEGRLPVPATSFDNLELDLTGPTAKPPEKSKEPRKQAAGREPAAETDPDLDAPPFIP